MENRGALTAGVLAPAAIGVVLAATGGGAATAAEHEFGYEPAASVRYTENVYRDATQVEADTISTLGVALQWAARTPRSTTRLEYLPEMQDYAALDQFDHVDHRLTAGWEMTPGRRSVVGVTQTAESTYRQPEPLEIGDTLDPVAPLSRRTIVYLRPYWRFQPDRDWVLETRTTHKAEEYEAAGLVDSIRNGVEFSARFQPALGIGLGARTRFEQVEFGESDSPETARDRERYLLVEALLSGSGERRFGWQASVGAYRRQVEGVDQGTEPSGRLEVYWRGQRLGFNLDYGTGISGSGGLGGSARRDWAAAAMNLRAGRAWDIGARYTDYSNTTFDDPLSPIETIDGRRGDLSVSYRWQDGVSVSLEGRSVHQQQDEGIPLDYSELILILGFNGRAAGRRPNAGAAQQP